MGESVNIKEYLDMFRRRKWIIIVIMLVCFVFGGYKTYKNYVSYVPTYESKVSIQINYMKQVQEANKKNESKKNSKSDDDDSTDTSDEQNLLNNINSTYSPSTTMTNQNIATSYVSLINSENVRNNIVTLTGLSANQIGSISAQQRETMPQFIDITVISSSPEISQKVANAVPEAYNQELIRSINLDCVVLDTAAKQGTIRQRPRDLTLVKLLAVGLVIAIFLVLLAEVLDTKIKTPEDVEKYWDLPLIGTIPFDDGKQKGRR